LRTYLDCFPCILKQALEYAKLSGADIRTQKKIIDKVARSLPKMSLTASPPETGRNMRKYVMKVTGNSDPYRGIKIKSNSIALRFYRVFKKHIKRSNDKLLTAIQLAIAGNIIDYGAKNTLNIENEMGKILRQEYKTIKHEDCRIFDYAGFKRNLKKTKMLLYIADNAGETVFDRVLIEEIKRIDKDKRVIYAVKEKATINDALMEDALASGVDKTAEIISCGADTSGTVLKHCNENFIKLYRNADMVISKGQGNFEALSDSRRSVFFLLKAKCRVIADHISSLGIKCKEGDVVMYYQKYRGF